MSVSGVAPIVPPRCPRVSATLLHPELARGARGSRDVSAESDKICDGFIETGTDVKNMSMETLGCEEHKYGDIRTRVQG